MQDTQLPPSSPPHVPITLAETITIVYVIDTFGENINPLTVEDLKRILDQSTQKAILCTDPVLVSIDELQKLVESIVREKVNQQEPPSIISIATSGQLQIPTVVSSGIVDTTVQKLSVA